MCILVVIKLWEKEPVQQANILASKELDQQPCPPSTKGAEFHSPKGVQMGVQESCGSKQVTLTPRRRFKHTAKRLVKLAAIFKSPFVSQCVRLFPKINH